MRKICFIVASILSSVLIGFNAFAEVKVTVTDAFVLPGDTDVIVEVILNDQAPAIRGVEISIGYDSDTLKFKEGHTVDGDWFFKVFETVTPDESNPASGQIKITLATIGIGIQANTTATLARLIFDMPESVSQPSYLLSVLDSSKLADTDNITIPAVYTNGTVYIDKPFLSISPLFLDIPNISGAFTATVQNIGLNTMEWQARTDDTWLMIEGSASGTDNEQLTILYKANTGQGRTGAIIVTAPDALESPQTISVSQTKEIQPVLSLAPLSQNILRQGGNLNLEVTNIGNGQMTWQASSDAPWLSIENGRSGTNSGIITLRCESNIGGQERTGTITVNADGPSNTPQSAELRQEGGCDPGDISTDGVIDLRDAILGLKVMTNMAADNLLLDAETNGDGKIGLTDVIYILEKVAK